MLRYIPADFDGENRRISQQEFGFNIMPGMLSIISQFIVDYTFIDLLKINKRIYQNKKSNHLKVKNKNNVCFKAF